GQRYVTPVVLRSTGHDPAASPHRPLPAQNPPLPALRPTRPPQTPLVPSYPLPGLPPSGLPRCPLRRVPGALPLLQALPLLAVGRDPKGRLRPDRPPGRPRPHHRRRPQRPAHPRCDQTRLPAGPVRTLRLRLPALEGRPVGPARPSPQGHPD